MCVTEDNCLYPSIDLCWVTYWIHTILSDAISVVSTTFLLNFRTNEILKKKKKLSFFLIQKHYQLKFINPLPFEIDWSLHSLVLMFLGSKIWLFCCIFLSYSWVQDPHFFIIIGKIVIRTVTAVVITSASWFLGAFPSSFVLMLLLSYYSVHGKELLA